MLIATKNVGKSFYKCDYSQATLTHDQRRIENPRRRQSQQCASQQECPVPRRKGGQQTGGRVQHAAGAEQFLAAVLVGQNASAKRANAFAQRNDRLHDRTPETVLANKVPLQPQPKNKQTKQTNEKSHSKS